MHRTMRPAMSRTVSRVQTWPASMLAWPSCKASCRQRVQAGLAVEEAEHANDKITVEHSTGQELHQERAQCLNSTSILQAGVKGLMQQS